AYASLMGAMETMCAAGHMDASELDLVLAATKAAHRHAEAQGFAPAVPRPLIDALNNYDVKHPARTVQFIAQAHAQAPPAPARGLAAVASPRGWSTVAASAPSADQTPFAHLKHKHIVGQGKGSAQRAAMQGGQQRDRVYARGARKDDPFVLVNQLNSALAAAGAPHTVRVDLIAHCPTGLAVSPRRPCSTAQLIRYKEVIASALGAEHVELDEQWERWVLHDVPTQAGSGPIDEVFLARQLEQALPGVTRGAAKRLCRQDEDWTTKSSTPIAFYSSVHAGLSPGMEVRILGRQFRLRRHQLRPSTVMCATCGSYRHKTASCESESRCVRCGKYGHKEEEHVGQCQGCGAGDPCVPQCMHCRGPHRAGERLCRNRPTWDRFARAYVLSRGEELSRINAQGDKSRNKLIRSTNAAGPAQGANATALGTQNGVASHH
ncbi:hypothetical protein OC844_007704, partial [Tilletia horrida]